MKKIISLTLIFVLILALGATAFADSGVYITKNPTDEVRVAGGTAWFVSGATNYSALVWNFMSPDGVKYTTQDFKTRFPYATLEGENSTSLTIRNLGTDMNRWGVFCSFYNNGSFTDTAMAFLYVSAYVAPVYTAPSYTAPTYVQPTVTVPYNGQFGGYGYDENGNLEFDVYYRDGSYTTYYSDGSSLTNNLDGSYYYEASDGSTCFYNENGYSMNTLPDGSYVESYADGSWAAYDASTDSYYGGMIYD